MQLTIDTSNVTFTVTRAAAEKKDNGSGKQKVDRNTGEFLWTVQVMALDDKGGEMLVVTVAGQAPKATVGQQVVPVELTAMPWATGDRNGVAFRAKELKPVAASVKSAA